MDSAVVTGDAQKHLVVYEVDLGLNHVVRKHSEQVPSTAHHLLAIPGDQDGPAGIIVACENFLIYKKHGRLDIKCPVPVRLDQTSEGGVFITNSQSFYNPELGCIIFL